MARGNYAPGRTPAQKSTGSNNGRICAAGGFIAIVSIAAIAAVGTNVKCLFEEVAGALANVTGGSYTISTECSGSGSGGGGGGTGPDLSALTFTCPAGEYLAGMTADASDCLLLPTGGGITAEIDPRNLAIIADDGNLCRANDQGEIVCDQDAVGLDALGCADGQIAIFTSGAWACIDADDGTIGGGGGSSGGNTFAVDLEADTSIVDLCFDDRVSAGGWCEGDGIRAIVFMSSWRLSVPAQASRSYQDSYDICDNLVEGGFDNWSLIPQSVYNLLGDKWQNDYGFTVFGSSLRQYHLLDTDGDTTQVPVALVQSNFTPTGAHSVVSRGPGPQSAAVACMRVAGSGGRVTTP